MGASFTQFKKNEIPVDSFQQVVFYTNKNIVNSPAPSVGSKLGFQDELINNSSSIVKNPDNSFDLQTGIYELQANIRVRDSNTAFAYYSWVEGNSVIGNRAINYVTGYVVDEIGNNFSANHIMEVLSPTNIHLELLASGVGTNIAEAFSFIKIKKIG